jgi:hypothetical protein
MFGAPSVSHEWDALAFGLSTIPGIAAMLLVAAAYWEQWRRRPLKAAQARNSALHLRADSQPKQSY